MAKASESKGGSHRVQRVERQIRDVVGLYLISGFKGELPGLVTITRVQMTSDLKIARVNVTLLASAEAGEKEDVALKRIAKLRKQAVKELNEHAHEAQRLVSRKLQMRYTPKVTYFYDEGYENAMKVERALADISRSRKSVNDISDAISDPISDSGSDD